MKKHTLLLLGCFAAATVQAQVPPPQPHAYDSLKMYQESSHGDAKKFGFEPFVADTCDDIGFKLYYRAETADAEMTSIGNGCNENGHLLIHSSITFTTNRHDYVERGLMTVPDLAHQYSPWMTGGTNGVEVTASGSGYFHNDSIGTTATFGDYDFQGDHYWGWFAVTDGTNTPVTNAFYGPYYQSTINSHPLDDTILASNGITIKPTKYTHLAETISPGPEPNTTISHIASETYTLSDPITTKLMLSWATPTNSGLGFQMASENAYCNIPPAENTVNGTAQKVNFKIKIAPGKYVLPLEKHVVFNNVPAVDTNKNLIYGPDGQPVLTNEEIKTVMYVKFEVPTNSTAEQVIPQGDPLVLRGPYTFRKFPYQISEEVNGAMTNYTKICTNVYGGYAYYTVAPMALVDDGRDWGCGADCNGNPADTSFEAHGMPRFWVTEPYINLWMRDTPAFYKASLGQEMAFTMTYRTHDGRPTNLLHNVPAPVPSTGWNHNWFSYILVDDGRKFLFRPSGGMAYLEEDQPNGDKILNLPAGGMAIAHSDGSVDIYNQVTATTSYSKEVWAIQSTSPKDSHLEWAGDHYQWTGGTAVGYGGSIYFDTVVEEVDPDSYDHLKLQTNSVWGGHGYSPEVSIDAPLQDGGYSNGKYPVGLAYFHALLWTAHVDAYGNATKLSYISNSQGQYFLDKVTDYDNNIIQFTYDNNNYLRSVSMPYGKTATTIYDATGRLLSVTDAQNITSTFNYADGPDITALNTPYGTTRFAYNGGEHEPDEFLQPSVIGSRSLDIIHPNNAVERYMYRFSSGSLDEDAFNAQADLCKNIYNILGTEMPDANGFMLDNPASSGGYDLPEIAGLHTRNSYHWKPGADISNFNAASVSHWLMRSDGLSISDCRSAHQEPAFADGRPGPITWYAYSGTDPDKPWMLGTDEPKTIATLQLMPSPYGSGYRGNTAMSETVFNDDYLVSSETSTYEDAQGQVGTHTTSYAYDSATHTVNGAAYTAYSLLSKTTPATTVSVTTTRGSRTTTVNGISVTTQPVTKSVVTDGLAVVTNEFNTLGQLTARTGPAGGRTTYTYGGDKRLYSVKQAFISQPTTVSWSNGCISGITTPTGVHYSAAYDNLDRLLTLRDDTAGILLRSNTFTALSLTSVNTPLGTTTINYDIPGNRKTITDPLNHTTTFNYCSCGALLEIIDPLNNHQVNTIDPAGRVNSITQINADGQMLTTTYMLDSVGRTVGAYLPAGIAVSNSVNMQGQVTETSVYDEAHWWRSIGRRTYDNLDRLTDVYDVLNRHVTISYDSHNRPYTATLTTSDGTQTLGTRNYTGIFLTSVVDPLNHPTAYGYDTYGRLNKITNADNGVISYMFDAYGRVVTRGRESGANSDTYGYNIYNQVIWTLNVNWHTAFNYDSLRRLTNVATLSGLTVGYVYGDNGKISQRIYRDENNLTQTSTYLYDAMGRLRQMTDPVGTTTYTYKDFGAFASALASETTPFGVTVNYDYDNYARLHSVSAGGFTSTYGYDELNRLSSVANAGGTVNFHYTDNFNGVSSQVDRMSFPGGVDKYFQYNGRGQVNDMYILQTYAGYLSHEGYGYDENGRRKWTTRPGYYITYNYDDLGQLLAANAFESDGYNATSARISDTFNYTYDKNGNITTVIYGVGTNNSTQTFENYAAQNSILNITTPTNQIISGGIDQVIDQLTVKTAVSTNDVTPYQDKTFGAVIPGTGASVVFEAYKYNTFISSASATIGNKFAGQPNTAGDYRHSITNLTGATPRTFKYDSLGNLTYAQGEKLAYDGANLLRLITHADGSTSKLIYAGTRVIQEINTDAVGKQSVVNYTYGHGLLARTDADGPAYYHTDANGNVVDMTDRTGNLVAHYSYEPYGQIIAKSGKLAEVNLYRFSSERYLPAANLYYYGYRVYSPDLRRWLNEDPIGYAGGRNKYMFVNNDPINGRDWLGLDNYCPSTWEKNNNVSDNNISNITLNKDPNYNAIYHGGQPVMFDPALYGDSVLNPPPRPIEPYTEYVPNGDYTYSTTYNGTDPFAVMGGIAIMEGTEMAVIGLATEGAGLALRGGFRLLSVDAVGGETYYRTMTLEDYALLNATRKLPATSETFISPSFQYACKYDGVTVKFNVSAGTTDALMDMGVRNSARGFAGSAYESLPIVDDSWTAENAFFKWEKGVINIGLGRGSALDTFNNNIVNFNLVTKP